MEGIEYLRTLHTKQLLVLKRGGGLNWLSGDTFEFYVKDHGWLMVKERDFTELMASRPHVMRASVAKKEAMERKRMGLSRKVK